MKNPGQASRLEVEFVISQGQDIIPHVFHQPKFHGLFPGQHMEEGTHEKIPAVEHQDRMISLLLFLFYDRGDPGPAPFGRVAPGHLRAIVEVGGKTENVGMEIVGMEDGDFFLSRKKIGGQKKKDRWK